MADVIMLETYRQQSAPPPPEPQMPWHVAEALWVLQEISMLADPLFVNEWEMKFILNMATWRGDLSPRQKTCLKRIADRVELVKKRPDAPGAV